MIRIERRIYWFAGEGTDNRVDRWLGIADSSLSLAARELCCLLGVDNGFRKAAARLEKLGQIQISAERLRTVTESEGSAMPMLDEMILDFYHFAEHVGQASVACWGLDSRRSKAWTAKVLHAAKHEGALAVLQEIAAARSTLRSPLKRTALSKLEQYVGKRVEMMDYPKFVAAGFDIGSGPTEAKCKTVPARLKGSGMRWNLPNAEAMAALACVEQSNMLDDYWSLQRQRVA